MYIDHGYLLRSIVICVDTISDIRLDYNRGYYSYEDTKREPTVRQRYNEDF